MLNGEAIMGEKWGLGWRVEHKAENPGKLVGR